MQLPLALNPVDLLFWTLVQVSLAGSSCSCCFSLSFRSVCHFSCTSGCFVPFVLSSPCAFLALLGSFWGVPLSLLCWLVFLMCAVSYCRVFSLFFGSKLLSISLCLYGTWDLFGSNIYTLLRSDYGGLTRISSAPRVYVSAQLQPVLSACYVVGELKLNGDYILNLLPWHMELRSSDNLRLLTRRKFTANWSLRIGTPTQSTLV